MRYEQRIILKNGKEALIRNGDGPDGSAVFEIFNLTHAETDYLLSYPDENSFDPEQEAEFLEEKTKDLKNKASCYGDGRPTRSRNLPKPSQIQNVEYPSKGVRR